MKRSTLVRGTAVTGAFAIAITLTSCAGSAADSAPSSSDLTIGSVDLSADCPATIVVQTDWNPEAEHGHLYEMIKDDYTIDAGTKAVTGPLKVDGEYTGVNLEIRAGGPAIGFQTVSAQMYQDDSITLGYVSTDEAIQLSSTTPTKAVFAPLDISPTMVMWDPTTYPNVKTIQDVKPALEANKGVWRYFDGSAYIEYLKSSGLASADILDGSYDGTPSNFVAAGGKDMQQGFASAEPYVYENEVSAWGKPVDFALIHDSGWQTYQSSMSVKAADFDTLSPCLTKLVPVLQKAGVAYYKDPKAANDLILKLVEDYDTGWTYTQGVADYSVKTQVDLGLVGDGPDSTYGNFDDARFADFFDKASKVYTDLGTPPASGYTPEDLYTNEFIDTSISF
ncbi:MAG: ABC transporter substrate-binding protein [Microbacterium sp.]|uniref:ABC transporter substrate-binding protein n=1 Tax=Microbacterium sp. TaxID=51671 RepID=UPI0025D4C7AB|nr:ABC transporter substrate-binding protein [Microbacterium sp.]MBQ9918776.1 ABC transporter substrate-binding protein [Microbacterium sp.]